MAIQVKCPHPDCGALFQVGDEMMGDTVECPGCNREVPVEPAEEPTEAAAGEGVQHHPARQQCTNCGAILGVRETFCPQCGADIRTGEAAPAPAARQGLKLLPILIGGGIFVALVGLGLLIFFGVRMLSARSEEREQAVRQEQAEQQEAEEKARQAVQVQRQPEFQVPEEVLSRVQTRQAEAKARADEYLQRVQDVLSRLREADAEEMAGRWADLYVFCRDEGMHAEAEQAWMQAVALRPADSETNRKLGRTETVGGVPVTPEQKEFIESLNPRVELTNANPAYSDHFVRLNDAQEEPVPWGRTVTARPESGMLQLEVCRSSRPDRPVDTFRLPVAAGVDYRVEICDVAASPGLPAEAVQGIYRAAVGGANPEGVTVQRNQEGGVESLRVQNITLEGMDGEPLEVWLTRRRDQLGIVGRMTVGNRFSERGQHVLCGTSQWPISIGVSGGGESVRITAGACARVQAELSDSMWGMLGTADGDLASEWARTRLAERVHQVRRENAELEANARLEGPWDSLARLRESLEDYYSEVMGDRERQDAAAALGSHVDRVRALNAQPRQDHLWLNWPRFREALAGVLDGSAGEIFSRIDETGRTGGAGTPALFGGGQDEYAPPAVGLGPDGRVFARMKALAMLPDSLVVSRVREEWDNLTAQQRSAAMVALEQVADSEAAAYLGGVTERTQDTSLMERAFLSLGVMGTPEALVYCDVPTINPETRTATMAALAVAGDPGTLDRIAQYASSNAQQGRRLAGLIAQTETPGALLALTRLIEAGAQLPAGAVAQALVRMQGPAAMVALGQLMEQSGTVFPDLLSSIPTEEAALLLNHVRAGLAREAEAEAAAELLARVGSDAALAFLQEAAINDDNTPALRALVLHGAPQSLTAAAEAPEAVTLAVLKQARDGWYEMPEDGEWTWSESVDPTAAREFLQTVLTEGQGPRVRVAAATMLREIGEPVTVEHLVALAREPDEDAGEAEQSSPSSQSGGGRPGPPPGVPAGVPPGVTIPGRGGGGGGGSADVPPADFEEPEGRPLQVRGLNFSAPVPFYALKLLEETPGEGVSQELRALGEGYRNGALKAAAFKALTTAGGDEELEYLRGKAIEMPEEFSGQAEWVNVLEMRVAAMAALGEAGDAAFLPRLLDVLQEAPPAEESIGQTVQNYGVLSDWWGLKLTDWANRCLADVCRQQGPAALTGNSDLEEQLVRSVEEVIRNPGSAGSALNDLPKTVRANAIRAYGRIASPSVYSHQRVVNRLVQSLGGLQESQQPRSRSGAPRRGRAQQPDELSLALVDALAHMATRAGGSQMQATLSRLIAEPGLREAWNDLMVEMAAHPPPGYMRLVDSMLASLSQQTMARIVRRARDAEEAESPEFARAVAVALQGPLPEVEEAPVVAEAEEQRRVGRGGRPLPPPPGQQDVPQQDGPPEWITEEVLMGQDAPPPEVMSRSRGTSRINLRGSGPGRAPVRRGRRGEPGEGDYARHGARRRVNWSYSLEDLLARLNELRTKQRLVELLLDTSGEALGQTLRRAGWLKGSVFGPEAALRYLERQPDARSEVIAQLGNMLLVGLVRTDDDSAGPGFSSGENGDIDAETRRAAVLALRHIGGDAAAEALYIGLVGPQRTGRTVPGAGRSSPVAVPIARALGSMGETARLRTALNARGHLFFNANPTGVQRAALSGMAYLPSEQNPLQLLGGLLRQASVEQLRNAIADAISTVVRRKEPSGGETA
ncbi:MAG: hypothetical protein R6X33_15075 [Candidatus Brocadiia bacterium]